VHLRWEETKEGDTVHGARLRVETGAGFPISITCIATEGRPAGKPSAPGVHRPWPQERR
jgi:hypothetical protein